jgi:hypothetical protein
MLSLNNEQEKEFRDICPFLLTKFNKNFKHIFLGEEIGYDISLNERMLENTVISWLYDKKRHMDYHNIESVSADFISDMLYNFRYRDTSPESLFPTLYLLQKALDNKIQI